MKITKHTVVSMDYTLRNAAGEVLDSSQGRTPLVYLHGVGQLIPGLENELEGQEKGNSKKVVVPAAEAYGERHDDLYHVVPKSGFTGDEEMFEGMQVQLDTDNGPTLAVISAIDGDTVTLDLNHPLAGEELHFEVSIVDLREATADEISHGHVHGPGGHHH
jgi:FKBP-type peptidyl-prolyl cis-trans isomerase SlyD